MEEVIGMDRDSFEIGAALGAVLIIPFLVTWNIAAYFLNEGVLEQISSAVAATILAFVFLLALATPEEPDLAYRIAIRTSPANVGKVDNKIRLMLLVITECLSVSIPTFILAFVL